MRARAVRGMMLAMALLAIPARSSAHATTRSPAVSPAAVATARAARVWRQAHERVILSEFASLLALPNVASDAGNIERNVSSLEAMLERRGLRVHVLRSGSAPPIVVGDLPAHGPPARTLAFYAHYDGQPADTLSWRGLAWTPGLRDARVPGITLAGDARLEAGARPCARSSAA